MFNKNTNHVFLSAVTVQFHIAHLYEIQVSLFSFLFSTLFPKTQVFLSFAVEIDLTLLKPTTTHLKSRAGRALLFCCSSFWTRCRQNLKGSRECVWVGGDRRLLWADHRGCHGNKKVWSTPSFVFWWSLFLHVSFSLWCASSLASQLGYELGVYDLRVIWLYDASRMRYILTFLCCPPWLFINYQ